MSGVRDPAFWKRFSYAVHLDDETGTQGQSRPDLKHNDSWLAEQHRKRSRRTRICCIFWLAFFIFIAAVVAVIIWLLKSGVLDGLHIGSSKGTPSPPVDPNSDVTKLR